MERTARRKPEIVKAAISLNDLKVPPGNRIEKLSADRKGQYSIRINDQYRIYFIREDGYASEVEIVDYQESRDARPCSSGRNPRGGVSDSSADHQKPTGDRSGSSRQPDRSDFEEKAALPGSRQSARILRSGWLTTSATLRNFG
jgi:proteic killer suppression protein